MTRRRDPWRWAGNAFLLALFAFTMLPLLWMLLTSVKPQFAALQYPPQWLPDAPTLEQYTRLLSPTSDVGREFLQ